MQAAYDRYREIQTQTAPATELTLLLYRGAVRFLNQAGAAIDRRDVEAAHWNLVRAQAIVQELLDSLNLNAGPLAHDLARIYHYILERIVAANVAKNRGPVDEVLGYLRDLLSSWEEAFAASQRTASGGNYGRSA